MHRQRTGRARGFCTGGGDMQSREACIIGNQRTYVLLLDEPTRGHVPTVERLDLITADARILDRPEPRLNRKVTEGALPELTKERRSCTDYCYFSHSFFSSSLNSTHIRIFP
jgi:hypothetical protein